MSFVFASGLDFFGKESKCCLLFCFLHVALLSLQGFFFLQKEFVFVSCRWYGFFRKVFFLFCKICFTRGFVCVFCMAFFCAKGLDLFFCKVSFVLQWVFFCFVALQSVFFAWFFVRFFKCCFLARGSTFIDFCKILNLLRNASFFATVFFFKKKT